MVPASSMLHGPLDEVHDRALGGRRQSRRRRRALRALSPDTGGLPAPPAAQSVAAVKSALHDRDHDGGSIDVDTKPGRVRARLRPKTFAVAVALVLAIGTSLAFGQRTISTADRAERSAERYKEQLDTATTRLNQLVGGSTQQLTLISSLQGRLSTMHARMAEIKASKVRTVVKTRVVTKEVPRWVPNGTGIEVDTTGFEGRIEIRDVQLTHAYGYSHLIGVAINKSGETMSYAQLGCTFVDADGRLLANEIVNKATWAPGQSWGFDCSAQVDGSGGVLRVDEMT
jgi:hypothetical protein